jgi:hypothetical protein
MQHQTSNETINRLHKGDRLMLVKVRERWNAVAQIDKAKMGRGASSNEGIVFIVEQTQRRIQQMSQQPAGKTFVTPLFTSATMPLSQQRSQGRV